MEDSEHARFVCPYRTGAPLTTERSGEVRHYTISKTYRGGEDVEFTNSCTVLLRLRSEIGKEGEEEGEEEPQEQVLKIIDSRFANTLRETHKCEAWSKECANACHAISDDQKELFLQWLCQPASVDVTDNDWWRPSCGYGILPPKPSNFDIFRQVLRNSRNAEKLLQGDIIPVLPTAGYRELFLRYHCELQAATENYIAERAEKGLPGRMPKSYGVWNVYAGWLAQDACVRALDKDSAPGLLMQKACGTPIALITDETAAGLDVKLLLQEMTLLQLQSLRLGLQIIDPNLHNFLLRNDSQNTPTLSMVDFGALSIIHPDRSQPPSIKLSSRQVEKCVQMSSEHYRSSFHHSLERAGLYSLMDYLGVRDEQTYTWADQQLTRLTSPEVYDHLDCWTWLIILLSFLRTQPAQALLGPQPLLFSTYAQVKQILCREIQRQEEHELWWLHSVTTICSRFGYDAGEACHWMTRIREELRSILSHTPPSECSTTEALLLYQKLESNRCRLFQPKEQRYSSEFGFKQPWPYDYYENFEMRTGLSSLLA